MANPAMETKARIIFRDALATHYIDGLPEVGDQASQWLLTHGGWFPDPQGEYDGETPPDQGGAVMSPQPVAAMEDAKTLMMSLWNALTANEADLKEEVRKWLGSLTARIARSRSRSPLRVQPLSELARAALDVVCTRDADSRVESQRQTIVRLQQEIADLRAGKGPVGPILVAVHEKVAPYVHAEVRAETLANNTPVVDYLYESQTRAAVLHNFLSYGVR